MESSHLPQQRNPEFRIHPDQIRLERARHETCAVVRGYSWSSIIEAHGSKSRQKRPLFDNMLPESRWPLFWGLQKLYLDGVTLGTRPHDLCNPAHGQITE